jgi:hypothetical protein
MKRIVRLTESDLARIVRRIINEQAPTPNTAVKKPSTIQLSYGNITVSIRYDANQDYVYLTGASKMPDGNLRGLKGTSNVSTNIDEMVSKFMGGNGLQGNFRVAGQTEKFMDALKTKLTEMNNNVQNYKKSTPSQK